MKKPLFALLTLALLLQLSPALAAPPPAEASYAGKTVILYTANVNGDLDIYPQIAHIKKDYASKGADVLLVDAGNYLRGSAAANGSMGEAVYALMDAAGYDVAAMGLAEFSYTGATTGYPYHGNVKRCYTQAMLQDGTEELTYNVNKDGSQTAVLPAKAPAKFQTVCSNVLPNEAYSFQRYVDVTTPSGFTVRFLGVTDPAVAKQVQDGYVTVLEPAMPLDDFADVIITLSNDPALAQDGTLENALAFDPGVGFLGAAMVIDNATGKTAYESLSLGQSDPQVAALAEEWKVKAPELLFTSTCLLNGSDKANWNGETNLGDLVTDALRWYAENYVDGINRDYPMVAIQNGGNCDDFLYPGEVTGADLLKALPFSPMGIGVIQLTGAQLLETLEAAAQSPDCPGFAQVSGLRYALNTAEPYDGGEAYGKYFVADSVNRVAVTDVDGAPFDPNGLYNVVCDNFLINGNDTYYTLKAAKEAGAKYINNGNGVKVRDAVELYVRQTMDGVVGETYAAPQGRITIQRFHDVAPDHWGFDAVNWAVEAGITQGTGDGMFSPGQPCSLWEIKTFLARAIYGEEPAFDPDSPPCTRAIAVDLVWQFSGSPQAAAPSGFTDVDLPFTDLPQAVAWAVENGVTTGTSETTFSPEQTCTRAEIVTLLHRAVQKGLLCTL